MQTSATHFQAAMLRHADFRAIQVYTHMSIRKLLETHAPTPPAKVDDREALVSPLATEDERDLSGQRTKLYVQTSIQE